jgi:plasmid stability protein
MASLTIKNVPDQLLKWLREAAAEQRRSLNQQVILILELALAQAGDEAAERLQAEIKAQAAAWERLAGRWSDVDDHQVDSMYESRSTGRPVRL